MATLTVGNDQQQYATIQEAIDASASRDTLRIDLAAGL